MISSSSHTALSPLGTSCYHGRCRRVGIAQDDRLGHMWILGKTGVGKSTFLLNLIYADLQAGRGLIVLDPHGDLVEGILALVPAERLRDTLYFNPADTAYPVAFNPMDHGGTLPAALIASGIIGVLRKHWPEFWGPRMEYILRASLLTLLASPGATLLDLHRLLVDTPFREHLVQRVTDPQLLQFWKKEFASYPVRFRTEAVAPIVNKTGQYLTMPMLRYILGQPKSAFSLRSLMDQGGIFLANLAKGRLGEDVTALLGSLLVSQVELAALSRADVPESERPPFFLYIDEAHLMATRTMVELFPEARKFHLGIVLAHQYLAQLPEEVRTAVLGNVGTLVAFRLGAHDAEALAPEFTPEVQARDLVHLPAHHLCLKLLVDGTTSRPFSVMTRPAPRAAVSYREQIMADSRRRYGKPVAEVEAALRRGWQPDTPRYQQGLGI